ncbi:MAG: succinate dehydrogenase, hydrophobic membrane anchor protein [Gammaproteobacteria bacterium]|nr:succinate dehydrogenase, hydrophobic membrane anchor protein [Gammaproteobacteria bacterium]
MNTALSGFKAWLIQRLTAVLLVLGSFMLLGLFAFPPAQGFDAFQDWIHEPWPVVSILLFGLALVMHAWVGVRDVIMDYVHSVALRLMALTVLAGYLLGSFFWLLWILVQ